MNTNAGKSTPFKESQTLTEPVTPDYSYEAAKSMMELLKQMDNFVYLLTRDTSQLRPESKESQFRPLIYATDLLKMARDQLALDVSLRTPPTDPDDVRNMTPDEAVYYKNRIDRNHNLMKVKMEVTYMMQAIDAHVQGKPEREPKVAAVEAKTCSTAATPSDAAGICRDAGETCGTTDDDATLGSQHRETRWQMNHEKIGKRNIRTPSLVKERVKQFEVVHNAVVNDDGTNGDSVDVSKKKANKKREEAKKKRTEAEKAREAAEREKEEDEIKKLEAEKLKEEVEKEREEDEKRREEDEKRREEAKKKKEVNRKERLQREKKEADKKKVEAEKMKTEEAADNRMDADKEKENEELGMELIDLTSSSTTVCGLACSSSCDSKYKSTECGSKRGGSKRAKRRASKCKSAQVTAEAKCDPKPDIPLKRGRNKLGFGPDGRPKPASKAGHSHNCGSQACCKTACTSTTNTATTVCSRRCDVECECPNTCGSETCSKATCSLTTCAGNAICSTSDGGNFEQCSTAQKETEPISELNCNLYNGIGPNLNALTSEAVLNYFLKRSGVQATYEELVCDVAAGQKPFEAAYNYKCNVYHLEAVAEGRSARIAKQEAAIAMMAQLLELQENRALPLIMKPFTEKELKQMQMIVDGGVKFNALYKLRKECRKAGEKVPVFKILATKEPCNEYTVTVQCNALDLTAVESGPNKRIARRAAAQGILRQLYKRRTQHE